MLCDLARQVQHLLDDAGRCELVIQVGGPSLDDLSHQVDRASLREHREIGVEADAHPVLGHDAFRKGVVGEGHRVFVEALTQLRYFARQQADALAQALPQLAGRLAREGEAKDR